MRLDAEHHNVRDSDRSDVRRDSRANREITIRAHHLEALLLHRLQMRAPCRQHDIGTSPGELGAQVATDRAGACNDDFHERDAGGANAWATSRRWIFPVAVRGMASVIWICLGRLKSASRSRQYPS